MIKIILENGLSALAAYTFIFAAVMLGLFVLAAIVNACTRQSKFNIVEIRKVFFMTVFCTAAFAVLDYFFTV